jgi:SAM-dependent methyltransferase
VGPAIVIVCATSDFPPRRRLEPVEQSPLTGLAPRADPMTKIYKEGLHPLGFHEALPKPSEQELGEHYREKYFQQSQVGYSAEYRPDELEYFHNVARVALAVCEKLGVDASLLDLGCGEGFFARSFHSFGWSVACCDFSEFGITRHNAGLLPFFRAGDLHGLIERYRTERGRFGLINLQNVLEHVIDPIALLAKLKPLFAERSTLRIRVPNDYSKFQRALVERGDTTNTWFNAPEHLSYFDSASLSSLLDHCGYRLLSLQADFPIELFLANPHSNYWRDRSLGKAAHLTRVFCENYLIGEDIDAYIQYSEAAGKLGFGRELIVYAAAA